MAPSGSHFRRSRKRSGTTGASSSCSSRRCRRATLHSKAHWLNSALSVYFFWGKMFEAVLTIYCHGFAPYVLLEELSAIEMAAFASCNTAAACTDGCFKRAYQIAPTIQQNTPHDLRASNTCRYRGRGGDAGGAVGEVEVRKWLWMSRGPPRGTERHRL